MKSFAWLILCLLLIAGTGCGSSRPLSEKELPEPATIVTVECNSDPKVKDLVMQLLRTARVNDWHFRDTGGDKEIEARYKTITPRQEADIEERLRQSAGVLNVVIKKERVPLKNDS